MRSSQRGATLIGTVAIVAVLAFGAYGGIRLFPVYMEYLAVSRALDQTAKELSGNGTNVAELRTSLDRRWTIEDIKSLAVKDVEIKKAGTGFNLRAWYRAEAPFVGNVSLVADFDKTVNVKGP